MKIKNLEKNLAIIASAGCGKTEELAMRFIKLLDAGAKPESILAMTFTRLAAGEMLDRVLDRLSEAVLDSDKKQKLIEQLWGTGRTDADFKKLLKLIIDKLNCLRLATLDSFFVELITCFAPELDIDLNLQLTDDFSKSVLETKALDKIYSDARKDEDYYRELKKVFDKITQGNEESSVERKLEKGIEKGYELFLRTKKEAWENFPVPDIDVSDENGEKIIEELLNCEGLKMIKNKKFDSYLKKINERDWDGIFSNGPVKNFIANKEKFYQWPIQEISKDVLEKIVDFVLARKLNEVVPATKAYHKFLTEFHEKYKEIKSNSGLITFSDICRILNNDNSLFMDAGKIEMYFRLDATIKHLLIDEFQDTSWDQWQSIFPIAEEIISDTTGDRSFFIVGDIKQAIYGWRGGDAELFNKIVNYYQTIKSASLEKSWRSGNNILNPINEIFNYDQEKIKKWKEKSKFKKHTSAVTEKKPGYTEVRYLEPTDEHKEKLSTSDKQQLKQKAVIELLKKIKPWARGLKTALLFSQNKDINEWSTRLKAAGIPCFNQGKSRLLDNVAVLAVLALFKWMDMPEDPLAEFHVKNSFLCEEVKTKAELFELKSFLFYNSYSKLIEKVVRKIKKYTDEMTNARLDQLIETAEQFQPNASTCPSDFIDYVEKIHKKEPPTSEGVVLVTMHSSKGMTYDIVILPELEKAPPNSGKIDFLEEKNEFDGELKQPETETVLLRPASNLVKTNPKLNSMLTAGLDNFEHEFYNKMYVALTRAAEALYIVCSKGNENHFSKLIMDALDCKSDSIKEPEEYKNISGEIKFQKGRPLWFVHKKLKTTPQIQKPKILKKVYLSKNSERRRQYITPSSASQNKNEKKFTAPKWLRKKAKGAERGTIIHELFAKVDWLNEDIFELKKDLLKVAKKGSKTFSETELLKIIEEFLEILKKDEIKNILKKTESQCEVFNEKSFALIIDKKLVRGTFDRVVLYPNSIKPEKIEIYDYKTDLIDTEQEITNLVEKYNLQMEIYTKVLSKAYNISVEKISQFLIFTSPGIVKKCGSV